MLRCRTCGTPLSDWQGKGGPNRLLEWTQGIAEPTGEGGDDEYKLALAESSRLRLPQRFVIYANCSGCHGNSVSVTGFCTEGTWDACAFGEHLEASSVPAFAVEARWRQCSACTEAWEEDPGSTLAGCPACGALTSLVPQPKL